MPARANAPASLIVISDLLSGEPDEMRVALKLLRSRGWQVTIVQIVDPAEADPAGAFPSGPEGTALTVELIDLESAARLQVTPNQAALAQYDQAYRAWQIGGRFSLRIGTDAPHHVANRLAVRFGGARDAGATRSGRMSGLQLLAPIGLLALVGIPLVIFFHMRNTTPIERAAPTLRFWRMVTPTPTADARFRRPPFSLLLLLQLLAVAALGLALARPAVTDAWAGLTQRTEPKHLVVLLDGSTSMSAVDTETGASRFDAGKALALQRIDALRDGDVATVMVLGSSVQSFEATDDAGMSTLTDRLKTLALPGGRADLNAALSLAGNLMLPDLQNQVLVITDGATAADPAVVAKVNAPIELLEVGQGSSANLAVVQMNARTSGTTANKTEVFARLANFSGDDVTATVSLLADGVEVQTASVPMTANQKVDFTSKALPAGATRLQLLIHSDDVLPADNSAELVLARDSDLAQRILLVSNTPLVLQRALSALPGAQVTTVSTTEALSGNVDGGPFDLTFFENYAPASASEIVTPVFFVHPPVDGLLPASGVMSVATVQHVRSGDPLLVGVDLTGLTLGETPIHALDADASAVVEGESGPLLYRGTMPGTSEPMIVMTFDLEASPLPQRVAFPILMTNIVRALAPAALPVSAALGDPVTIQPRAGVQTVHVTAPGAETTDIPVTQSPSGAVDPAIFSETGKAGEYRVEELDSKGQPSATGSFMVNAGHPDESNLSVNSDLPGVLATAAASGANGSTRQRLGDLWPALAALALGVLAFEWLWTTVGAGMVRRPGFTRGVRT